MPHVKVSVGFYLKDKPKGHLGLTQETWTLGDEPTTFGALVYGFVRCLLEFYLATMPTPTVELNAHIKEAGEAILDFVVTEE